MEQQKLISQFNSVAGSLVSRGELDPELKIVFSDKTELGFSYWRLIRNRKYPLSNFDHGQQCGLPGKIDSLAELRGFVLGRKVVSTSLSPLTGDSELMFESDEFLQKFNFTANEVWAVLFADGFGQSSNYFMDSK